VTNYTAKTEYMRSFREDAEKFSAMKRDSSRPHDDRGPSRHPYPVMDEAAFICLPGDIVSMIKPHTESDPVAILFTFLTLFGNAVGRGPHFQVEGDRHGANLFCVLVGDTAKARKGTSFGRVREIVALADDEWTKTRIHTGLSSGEGVIWAVRDAVIRLVKSDAGSSEETIDQGVADKRLMVIEPEFAGVLRVAKREGNILTRVLRDAWDRGDLATMTKNSPARTTGAFISIIGHVTSGELKRNLDTNDMTNGFANRFLFACVRRSQLLPFGGYLSVDAIAEMASRVRDALIRARKIGRVTMSAPAAAAWEAVYADLSEAKSGMVGALTARQEAHTIRVALLHALCEGREMIEPHHLSAAIAVTEYSRASVTYIYGDAFGNVVADTILSALRGVEASGMTRTEISNLFGRNVSSNQIESALAELNRCGLAQAREDPPTGGRPIERWVATGQMG
jgi:hypothetical protein